MACGGEKAGDQAYEAPPGGPVGRVVFLRERGDGAMRVRLLKAKIHRARVTSCRLDYVGSLALDVDLMEAAGIYPYEQVLVANIDNGTRHETYVVPAERGSGEVEVLGAAAHLVSPGHKVIIMAYADMEEAEARGHKPRVVLVGEDNRRIRLKEDV